MANLATATIRMDFRFTRLGRAVLWACERLGKRLEERPTRLAGAAAWAFAHVVLRAPPRLLFRVRPARAA